MAELNITNIPAPRVPFIDERTGLMAREWYRFFLNMFVLTGSGSNATTLDELQLGPPAPTSGGTVTSVTGTPPVVSSGGNAPVISMPAATTSANGYLTSTDWNTFNNKGTVSSVSVVSANGLAGTVATATTTPAVTLSTTVTGVLKGNGTAISAAASGTDYAPATSGTSILYGSGAGGFSNVTIGTGVAFAGGTLSATGSGGTVTSVTGIAPVVSSGGATPEISMAAATTSVNGYLTSTDWTTFNDKGSGSVTSVAQSFTGGLISVSGSPITTSGTLALTVAGTSGGVPYFSSASTWATSAALAANALVIGGGAGAAPATTTTGTGVVTALGVNTGSAGAVVLFNGALGTPASGTVTNLTGTASININGTVGATTPNTGAFTTLSATDSANLPNTFGFKNRIINGLMTNDQRNAGASKTFTAAGALAYSVDRWYGYCTGANVTGQQIAGGTTPTVTQNRYRFTGAASVTEVGFGQRIEQKNSYDLAGSTCTLSADLAISATLTTVTWTASYATTTADTFGTLASPTVTQIATGTFTVSATVTNFSANISVPAAATTGIQIVFTVGALTAGLTWTIGNVQFEKGSTATSFDYRPYGTELNLCQRYYAKLSSLSGNYVGFGSGVVSGVSSAEVYVKYPVRMRSAPTLTQSNTAVYDGSVQAVTSLGTVYFGDESLFTNLNVFSGLTAGRGCILCGNNNAAAYIDLSSEL